MFKCNVHKKMAYYRYRCLSNFCVCGAPFSLHTMSTYLGPA